MEYSNIRKMVESDLEMVLQWRNHPDIRKYMYTNHIINITEHQEWFRKISDNKDTHLLIFEFNQLPLGFIQIDTNISNKKDATWGFYIAPNSPRGTGSKLGKAALDYAFNFIKIKKLCGSVIDFNKQSIKFHKKIGFMLEETKHDDYYDGKNYHDVLTFSISLRGFEDRIDI